MADIGPVVVLVLGAVVAVIAFALVRVLAGKAGVAARRRKIAETGEDPADNLVNNAVNRWAERHPAAARAAPVVFVVLVGAALLVWDR